MLELSKKRNDLLFNFRRYLNKIKESVESVLQQSHTYLFGSALEGKLVAGSDVDVLIVADVPRDHMKRADLIAKIEEKTEFPLYHPFEFHLIDSKEFEKWKNIYKLKLEQI
jgi:hypothetical protein